VKAKTSPRPTYLVTLQATPGHDDIRSLRALIKAAGRYYGLRVVSVREMPSPSRNIHSTRQLSKAEKGSAN
jgi:hypothetical protein